MATKKKISPALQAMAIWVTATIASRCRAGMVFTKEKETRIELIDLPEGALAAIEADPYLKVTYEADEMPYEGSQLSTAESRILELEDQLADGEAELKAARDHIANLEQLKRASDQFLDEYKAQIAELHKALEAKEAEVAELKAAASSKAKK